VDITVNCVLVIAFFGMFTYFTYIHFFRKGTCI